MKKIYKYPLQITDVQDVDLPHGAKILTVQMQGETACLWALVDPEAAKTKRRICIFGTGHPLTSSPLLRYISTFQMLGGSLVWHAFELEDQYL